MTFPLAGHPDFQDAQTWRVGTSIAAPFDLNPNTDAQFGAGAASNFAGISIALTGLNRPGVCRVIFGDQIPIVSEYRRNEFTFPAGGCNVQMPIDGLTYAVHVINFNGAAHLTGTIQARATNNVMAYPTYYTPNCFVSNPARIVAAGSTFTDPLPGLMPGPAQLRINSTDLTGNSIAVVAVYNTDGTEGDIIAEFSPIPNTENNVVYLPEKAVFIKLFNNSGAPVTFGYALYATGGLY